MLAWCDREECRESSVGCCQVSGMSLGQGDGNAGKQRSSGTVVWNAVTESGDVSAECVVQCASALLLYIRWLCTSGGSLPASTAHDGYWTIHGR